MKAVYIFIAIISSAITSRAEWNFGYINQNKCQIVIHYNGDITVIDSLANPDSFYISSVVDHKNNVYVVLSPRKGCVRIDELVKVHLLTKDVFRFTYAPVGNNPISGNEKTLVINLDKPEGKGAIYKIEDDSIKYLINNDAFTNNLSLSPDNNKLVFCALSGIWIYDFKKDAAKCLSKNICELLAPIWLDNERFVYYDANEQLVYKMDLCKKQSHLLIKKQYDIINMAYLNNRLLVDIRIDENSSNIYEYIFKSGELKLLIENKALIADIVWLNNNKFLFNSNLGGNWNIYEFDLKNTNIKNITDGNGDYWFPFIVN